MIEELEILKAIETQGSINAAAQKLMMAKSNISTIIKQAEISYGFKLLDRSSYKAKLTQKAKMYLEKAQTMLELKKDLQKYQKQLANNIETSIKISSSLLYDLSLFIELIKKANCRFPETSIVLEREVLSGLEMLNNNKVDLAITELTTDKVNFEYKKIGCISMPLVISINHPFIQKTKNRDDFQELKKYPQIVLRSTYPEQTGAGSVYQDTVKWNVSDDYTKLELIKKGLGWGRLPNHLIKKEVEKGSIFVLNNIEKLLEIDLYVVRKKNNYYGEVASFIWDILQNQEGDLRI